MATGDFVIRDIRHLRWSGSNGVDVAAMCDQIEVDDATWSVQSEVAGDKLVLLQYQSESVKGTWTVSAARPNVLVSNDFAGVFASLADAGFNNRYNQWGVMLQESIDAGQVLLPSYSLIMTNGTLPLPVLTPGSLFSAVVPLANTMAGTSYNVTWRATGGATVQPGKSIVKAIKSVTIPLQAVGATVAGLVTVEAIQLVAS